MTLFQYMRFDFIEESFDEDTHKVIELNKDIHKSIKYFYSDEYSKINVKYN